MNTTTNGDVSNGQKAGSKFVPIAICGMACRLPGGIASPQELWDFLIAGGDARCRVPDTRYNLAGYHCKTKKAGSTVAEHGYFLDESVDLGALDTSFSSMARAEVERVSRAKDEFIAVLSHELRTPLNAILTWSQLLQRAPGQLARGLDVIERNARTQSRLIADILDISRLDVGKVHLDLQPVDAAAAVREAVATLELLAAEKDIAIELCIT